ncbi:Eco57I restriction-modification methylase domain-containing protein [Patescibacteria group bacterium]
MNSVINYNPDVLDALANLSSDEVFTPPKVVNTILDTLPKSLWNDKNATFLDPASKSGVFLREIAKRLNKGLENEIPDLQERLNHIYTKQLFGIAITELTSLLSRRSLYCSKYANGEYSVCTEFEIPQGNIVFNKTQHKWKNGKCEMCGASQQEYDRDKSLETHAYEFIHRTSEQIFKFFNNKIMKFDVIIGNPPYQLNDGGGMGTSAKPLYQKFVEQSKKLNPRYLSMIIPARWYSGGKGLNNFRNSMLSDLHLKKLVDFFDSGECFPGVDISGGICYFLWERDSTGDCEIKTVRNGDENILKRSLLEKNSDTFIRFNEAVSILRKVQLLNKDSFDNIVSPRRPFAIDSDAVIKKNANSESIKIYAWPQNGYINKSEIKRNKELLNSNKVMIAKAYGERGSFPYLVIAKPFIPVKPSCCTETYLVIGPFETEEEEINVSKYISTKFFRFLVLLKKNTQNAPKSVYSFVPMQDFSEEWTDEKLYKKYKLTQEEIEFIESMIRPMN